MSQTVIIPSCMNPFEITINNHTYSFKAGESVEMPDDVAEVIKHHVDSVPKPLDKEEGSEGSSSDVLTQEKTVDITENGTTEITADEGYLLSKATVNVNVGGGENIFFINLVGGEIREVTAEHLQGVTRINSRVFSNLSYLYRLVLPEGLTFIGEYAFSNDTALKEVHIPTTLTEIKGNAFQSSGKVASVYITDISKWNSVKLGLASNPAALAYGKADFYLNNTLIKDLIIPEDITTIGGYVFQGYSFTSVTIPNGVTSIGSNAFANCSSLTNVTIGDGVTSMGTNAFYSCSAIEKFVIKAVTPPTIQSTTFKNVPDTCIYEIPAASYETYKAATNWSALNIIASEEF